MSRQFIWRYLMLFMLIGLSLNDYNIWFLLLSHFSRVGNLILIVWVIQELISCSCTFSTLQEVAVKKFLDQDFSGDALAEFKREVSVKLLLLENVKVIWLLWRSFFALLKRNQGIKIICLPPRILVHDITVHVMKWVEGKGCYMLWGTIKQVEISLISYRYLVYMSRSNAYLFLLWHFVL